MKLGSAGFSSTRNAGLRESFQPSFQNLLLPKTVLPRGFSRKALKGVLRLPGSGLKADDSHD
jgi:hypothetical protein